MLGQECCIGGAVGAGFADDQCATWNTACMNPPGKGLQVLCEQPADCTANNSTTGNVCCLIGTTPGPTANCNDPLDLKASGGMGTKCATSCAATDTQLCLSDGDCTAPKTCHAFRWKIIQLGACM
jgi:hypothetical protein